MFNASSEVFSDHHRKYAISYCENDLEMLVEFIAIASGDFSYEITLFKVQENEKIALENCSLYFIDGNNDRYERFKDFFRTLKENSKQEMISERISNILKTLKENHT